MAVPWLEPSPSLVLRQPCRATLSRADRRHVRASRHCFAENKKQYAPAKLLVSQSVEPSTRINFFDYRNPRLLVYLPHFVGLCLLARSIVRMRTGITTSRPVVFA